MFESRQVHHRFVYVPSKYTGLIQLGQSGVSAVESTQTGESLVQSFIWAGSESANAAACKAVPFGGSGLDTHPSHH